MFPLGCDCPVPATEATEGSVIVCYFCCKTVINNNNMTRISIYGWKKREFKPGLSFLWGCDY